MSSLTPAERVLRARLAAYSKWANHDPVEGTAAAARKAHFARLALKSAQARRARKEAA